MNHPEKRCINIDWLEVYALEPLSSPRDPQFFMGLGLDVVQRDYGTRIYDQMFKIRDVNGFDLIEVRRKPKQAGQENSILPINACHIRLSNRTCYSDNAVQVMQDFLTKYDYEFVKIFRIDICLDFERFDSGDDPNLFLHRYIRRKYSKINQAEGHGHFKDRWDGRYWNSVSWGSPKSAIGTKMYNKTLELQEVSDKPYIRQAWWYSGLVDDPMRLYKIKPNGTTYKPVIWRVEFSIRSQVKSWLTYEKDGDPKKLRSVRNTLQMYDSRSKLLAMFALLQDHYFHFRHFNPNKSKYDCPRKELFSFTPTENFYKVEHPSSNTKPETLAQRLLRLIQQYELKHPVAELHQPFQKLKDYLEKQDASRLLSDPYSHLQLLALQQAIAAHLKGLEIDPAQLIKQYEKTLSEDGEIW